MSGKVKNGYTLRYFLSQLQTFFPTIKTFKHQTKRARLGSYFIKCHQKVFKKVSNRTVSLMLHLTLRDFEAWEVFSFVSELPPLFLYCHSTKACSWQEQIVSGWHRGGPVHSLSKEMIIGTNGFLQRCVSAHSKRGNRK